MIQGLSVKVGSYSNRRGTWKLNRISSQDLVWLRFQILEFRAKFSVSLVYFMEVEDKES